MKQTNPNLTLIKPIITEKTLAGQANGKYSFYVSHFATKDQIAACFEAVFGAKVLDVNTSQTKGKVKMDPRRRQAIHKPDLKKAVITVKKDQKIDMLAISDKKK